MNRIDTALRRGILLLTCVSALLASACRRASPADLERARGELRVRATAVCAAPAVRPTHRPPPSQVNASDAALRDALIAICERGRREVADAGMSAGACSGANLESDSCRAAVAEVAKELSLVRDRLIDPRPTVALLRRNEMLVTSATFDFDKDGPSAARAAVKAAATRPCDPSTPWIETLLLAAARHATDAHDDAAAMTLCADLAALERDRFLVGNMTDALLGVAALTRIESVCRPMAEQAPDAAVAALRDAMSVIRKSAPPNLDEVIQRDLDEVFLLTLGPLRDASIAPSCDRARHLLERAPRTSSAAEEAAMVDGFRNQRQAPPPERSRYDAEYAKALTIMDRFLSVKGR